MSQRGKTWRILGAVVVIVAFLLVAVWRKVGFGWLPFGWGAAASSKEPAATPAELAVIAPLRAGSKLAGWDVDSVSRTLRGAFHVVLTQDGKRMMLGVQLARDAVRRPPCVVPPYSVYYAGPDNKKGLHLSQALCAVIKKNKNVKPPPGMHRAAATSASAAPAASASAAPAASASAAPAASASAAPAASAH